MNFIVQKDIWDKEDECKLIDVLNKRGIKNLLASHDNFIPINEDAFCYGSLAWIKELQKLNNNHIKTIATFDNYDFNRLVYRMCNLFNNDCEFFYLSDVIKNKDLLFNKHCGSFFIRPVSGCKPGGISGGLIKEHDDINYLTDFLKTNEDILVVIATEKFIKYEYRTIIYKNECITGCQYRSFCPETARLGFDPSVNFPDLIRDFANKVGSICQPDNIYVLDLVEDDRSISVMEINALSTSGWYDCDYDKIIDAVCENFR